MGSPLDSSAFVRLLVDDLRDVASDTYKDIPSMIPRLYGMLPSESAWEEFFAIGDVPDIPEFNGSLSTLSVHPGFHTKIEHKEYAAQLVSERKLVDDEKYGVIRNKAKKLMTSAARTKEKKGVRAFANSFSSAFDYMVSEENVSLCSSSHTTKSGTSTTTGFDNSGVDALSPTSVAATRLLMRGFKSDISERIDISDNLALVVPDNLADRAMEIVGTPKSLDTAEGNINVQHNRYEVIPYLRLDDSDTNNWFLTDKDKMKENLLWFDRIPAEFKTNIDWQTYAVMNAVYLRFSYGHRDWRWIYGHNVS